MTRPGVLARRMFELVEPIGVIPYLAPEPTEAMLALGLGGVWDAYFAGRAAPLGMARAEVVDALFFNFGPGEVARHIPSVWRATTPEAAIAARGEGCTATLRRVLGPAADGPDAARAAELLTAAATSAPAGGRPMYAALRAIPIPDDVPARLYAAASLLREHRGDGHVAALLVEGIGRSECHVLHALGSGTPADRFGRLHHRPAAEVAAVIDGLRRRGLVGDDGWLTDRGRALRDRIEARTDELAAPPYLHLDPEERRELEARLAPISARLRAVASGPGDDEAPGRRPGASELGGEDSNPQ